MTGNRLPPALRRALAGSRTLIVVCSPSARASRWVAAEIRHFAEVRNPDAIFPVLLAGAPNDDPGSDERDWAFPDALLEALDDEPMGPDFRLRSNASPAVVADEWTRLVANVVDSTPDELRQRIQKDKYRRLRTALAVVIAVTVALAGLVVWALRERDEAARQRDLARAQAELATSRQLAAAAKDLPAADADLSLVLAVVARQTAPTVQSVDALLAALVRNPGLVQYLHGTAEFSGVVDVSPDDEHAVGGASDGRLVQWDLATGIGAELSASGERIQAIAHSPSGRTILVARQDLLGDGNIVEAWDAETGVLLARRLFGHIEVDDVVALDESVAIVVGGDEQAGGGTPGLVARWRWATDQLVELPASRKVAHVELAPDGRLILGVGSFPSTDSLVIADATTGAVTSSPLMLDQGSINDLDSRADRRLATVTTGEEIVLIDLEAGRVLQRRSVDPQAFAAQFIDGGSTLAVWQSTATSRQEEDHAIHFYDVPSLDETARPIPVPSVVGGLAALHRSDLVLSAREHGGVAIWDAGTTSSRSGFQRHIANVELPPSDTTFTPDGSVTISTGPRAVVTGRDWDSGKELWRADVFPEGEFATATAAHPGGALVAIGGGTFLSPGRGAVVIADPQSGRVVAEHEVGTTQVRHLAFSGDGQFLFTGMTDLLGHGAVVALDLEDGGTQQLDAVGPIDLTIAGDHVAWIPLGGDLRTLSLAEVAAGGPPRTVALEERVDGVSALGQGAQVAVSSDGRVGVLDLDAVEPQVAWLGAHRTGVSSMTANSSGTVLASTDFDGELILWDLVTLQPLTSPTMLGTGGSTAAAFTPREAASELLLVGTSALWTIDGDPSFWTAHACAIANRTLTTQEWTRFVGDERPYEPVCATDG